MTAAGILIALHILRLCIYTGCIWYMLVFTNANLYIQALLTTAQIMGHHETGNPSCRTRSKRWYYEREPKPAIERVCHRDV